MESEPIILEMFEAERHYAEVATWWAGHGWEPVPQAILPRLGVIGSIDGQGIAAAWLYMDNSIGVAMLEWMVGNPKGEARQVLRALRSVVEFLKAEAKRLDYGVILTSCRQAGLVKWLQKRGFMKTDEGVTHMLLINQ